ncbi:uncharacterized protein EV154DRAFT_516330 [Mucor mucedo]|uniref:uncharacterized protein n=1 Tax=Mucor mucedo TaxID=29922 RepID=UPI0022211E34|nr:uncharacterized protein EV154DRAFT_516330 [Mucor mucedo]KAI7888920.1 hypothetical protein EV154DRAFT_516330 [Mucor mucedo]
MGAQAVDYRVSTLIVLCKDCGQDVGLYPARHKCGPIERPAMPTLPSQYQKSPPPLQLNARTISSGSASSTTSSSTSPSFSSVEQTPSKWSSRLAKSSAHPDHAETEESIYFNNFASNLPEDQPATGKKLWGKVKQNEKWKQLGEKNEKPKQSGKLWGKLMQATQTMADKIPSRDDRGADSDEDDWEGETHVSRILREYYEKKRLRLPEWLFDGDTPRVARKKSVVQHQDLYADSNGPVRTPSRRRLWEQNPSDPKNISSRERERQELRQAQPPPPPVPSNARNDRYHEEEDRYQRDNNYRDARSSNRYQEPQVDNYQRPYDDQPKSPNRRYYNDQPPPPSSTAAPRSERSARGYLQRDPPPQRVTAAHHQQYDRENDLDDYYYNNDSARDRHPPPRREPSLRTGGRRYGNDPSYF